MIRSDGSSPKLMVYKDFIVKSFKFKDPGGLSSQVFDS